MTGVHGRWVPRPAFTTRCHPLRCWRCGGRMLKKESKERRRYPRINARLAMQVERTGKSSAERPMTTESVNISSGGINCCVRSQLETATRVGLTILLPSFGRKGKKTQVISCNAVVVRSEPQP